MKTRVAIIGAGPAGLLLSHLLEREGIESIIVEAQSSDFVLGRFRAGLLEAASVDVLDEAGLSERLHRDGLEHRGVYVQWPGTKRAVDFVERGGRPVWVYGQSELTRDLSDARFAAGQQMYYNVSDVALHDVDSSAPFLTGVDATGRSIRIDADVIVGCDGFAGVSRDSLAQSLRAVYERRYPHSWLGFFADVPPSSDQIIFAWHPEGFAMHTMRSASISRFHLQVDPHDHISAWSDDRIWETTARRLGSGDNDWTLHTGPITEKSILPLRCRITTPMRHARLFLAGDAAHVVPPTGAKGLNLAIADVTLLARALGAWKRGDESLANAYSDSALRRVWRAAEFSWSWSSALHTTGDPFDDQLQLAQLDWLTSSPTGGAGLAEKFSGVPIAFG
ncbi:MAG: 4-hydroxybenzoate 3-monooxygenase [Tetrasphaera sp.]|nr:4-hydroxybenzoate 3-monooxygenase [Tetrasphaera sp.]